MNSYDVLEVQKVRRNTSEAEQPAAFRGETLACNRKEKRGKMQKKANDLADLG